MLPARIFHTPSTMPSKGMVSSHPSWRLENEKITRTLALLAPPKDPRTRSVAKAPKMRWMKS